MTETRENPTIEMFADRVGEPFLVQVGEDVVVEARLVEATRLLAATKRDDLPIRKDPFSLVLKGDANRPLEQRMYTVEHQTLGSLPMFIVPIGFGEYEVIFN